MADINKDQQDVSQERASGTPSEAADIAKPQGADELLGTVRDDLTQIANVEAQEKIKAGDARILVGEDLDKHQKNIAEGFNGLGVEHVTCEESFSGLVDILVERFKAGTLPHVLVLDMSFYMKKRKDYSDINTGDAGENTLRYLQRPRRPKDMGDEDFDRYKQELRSIQVIMNSTEVDDERLAGLQEQFPDITIIGRTNKPEDTPSCNNAWREHLSDLIDFEG